MERVDAEETPSGFTEFAGRPFRSVTNEYCGVRFPRYSAARIDPGNGVDWEQLDKALQQLEEVGRYHELPARTIFHFEGDPARSLHFVCGGRLKLSLTSHKGNRVIVRFAFAGDFLGLNAVLNQGSHEFIAETVEPTSVLSVARTAFVRLLRDSREVNALTTWALARDYQEMLRGVRRLGISNCVSGRLAQLLLNNLDSTSKKYAGMKYRMHLTRDELATMVNTTRETVTRIMKQFERDELIALDGGSLVILDPARLELLAG